MSDVGAPLYCKWGPEVQKDGHREDEGQHLSSHCPEVLSSAEHSWPEGQVRNDLRQRTEDEPQQPTWSPHLGGLLQTQAMAWSGSPLTVERRVL